MGYTTDTIKGFSWMSGFRLVTRLFAFVRIAILARLLTPFQFGVFGVASLVLSFFETFSQTGTNIFIVQERKKIEEYVNAAFVISIVRGFVITILIFAGSALFAKYFNSPDSLGLIRLICIVAAIRGFISPSRVKFLKDLKFNYEFYFSFAVFFADATISILFTYLLHSPVGMVLGLVAGAVVEVTLSHVVISPRPKFVWEASKINKMLKRGKWVASSSILNYFLEHLDDIVVGKMIGPVALGIYQSAYKIAMIPLTEIVKVINQVTFPIYSNISDKKWRLKRAFMRTSFGLIFLVVPIGFLLHWFSYEAVFIILGEKWLSAVPVVEALSLFGIARAMIVSVTPLLNSIKRQDLVAKTSFVGVLFMFLFIVPFVRKFGILGATYGVFAGSVATLPVIYYYLSKTLK